MTTPLRRHGVIADRATLEGETAKLWTVTTPDGGKFFMKELGYRRYRAWPSIEAMRRDELGDAVASSTSPTRVMELLAKYSSRQGSIVKFQPMEQAMHEEATTQELAKTVLTQSDRQLRELLKREDISRENRDVLRHAQSILEDAALPDSVPFFEFEAEAQAA